MVLGIEEFRMDNFDELINKDEAIHKGRPYDDKVTEDQIKWQDKHTLDSAAKRDPKWSKRKLNKLGLSSHRRGSSYKNVDYVTATDNIDRGTTKKVKRTTYGERALVGFKEVDFLRNEDDIEWIVMSEIDYATQLTLALPRNKIPKKVLITGNKVFLDPEVFVSLVKMQEDQNRTKLVISFDRATTRNKDGALSVVVANPKNPDHHRGASRDSRDDEWTRRFRSDGSVSSKKGV